MKQIIFLFSIIAGVIACESNPKNPKEPLDPNAKTKEVTQLLEDSTNWTSIQWIDSVQEFGKVTEGEKVVMSFHFKNTGSKPLVIATVSASCGCTVPSKPEEPIAPGAEGIIKAEFNSEGRVGKAEKYVYVNCNTSQKVYNLLFTGEVTAKK